MPNHPTLAPPTWLRQAALLAALLLCALAARAQPAPQVVDIPTRPGVTQRFLFLAPAQPRAAVILYAGGHGGLHIYPNGSFAWGAGNFLVRARQLFVDNELAVAVIDAPSDHLSWPFLSGFRLSPEHAEDTRAVIAWMRSHTGLPVWLVGTSRGTQSVAATAIRLADGGGPDGIVLTSTILRDDRGRPVPAMDLDKLKVPVLVIHHEHDGCKQCPFGEVQGLMDKLVKTPEAGVIKFDGGNNVGDPCEAMAYHGFNGIEPQVVQAIARWMAQR
ncbi:alpha/beta hydrolase [Cupriavidus basilensis]|uniref:Alpha/beta hydrolase n=1 Tax=Cupriavidus basilensis TaxID=68895 RepID=A0ABT6B1B2_9BURK|nr:alpha/beta hydrolase [Cupriavidus basilensis]MDF3838666.1 alpha/beta hydrolase [Cupriavidus basilensis]